MTSRTIAGLLDEAATARPGRPFLRGMGGEALRDTGDQTRRAAGGPTLTVGEVAALTLAGTRWLRAAGVLPGMTVAWQLPSHVRTVLLMLALARSAVTQAPIIHIYREREVAAAVDGCSADVLIVDESTAPNAPADIPVIRLPADFVAQLRALDASADPELVGVPHARRAAEDKTWVYFTSGTTGRPKGVLHTDGTLLAAANGFTEYQGLGDHPAETGALCFPVAHIGGMVFLASALIGDFSMLMVPRFTPAELPALLAEHRVTVTGGGSTFYQLLLAAQLASGQAEPLVPSLRMLNGGGAPCPPELHKQVYQHLRVPIVHAYGMTEAAMVCVSKATDTAEQRSFSSGSPIPGVEVRIAGSASTCEGEIEIRGANVTPGYLDAGQWAQALTADGWLRTGDRGYLRPDGRIVLTGRAKDLIIRKGENIAPDEIENELLGHPLVDEVVVLGQPDELRGELVCAVVRRSARHRDVTLAELCEFLDARGLMKQKWPERLVLVDEFPLTGLGKVAKTDLARQIAPVTATGGNP